MQEIPDLLMNYEFKQLGHQFGPVCIVVVVKHVVKVVNPTRHGYWNTTLWKCWKLKITPGIFNLNYLRFYLAK